MLRTRTKLEHAGIETEMGSRSSESCALSCTSVPVAAGGRGFPVCRDEPDVFAVRGFIVQEDVHVTCFEGLNWTEKKLATRAPAVPSRAHCS